MTQADYLVFSLAGERIRAALNGSLLSIADGEQAYRLLMQRCLRAAREMMLGFATFEGEFGIKLYAGLGDGRFADPLEIRGAEAMELYRSIYPPGRDPLLPLMVEIQVRGLTGNGDVL